MILIMQTRLRIEEKALRISQHIDEKVECFRRRLDHAPKIAFRDFYWERYVLYRTFQRRAFLLVINLRNPKKFGECSFLNTTPNEYKKQKAQRVEQGELKFQRKHTYATWFYGTGLHQDYGKFICDKCCREFYHSPSRIKRAGKIVYDSACGYCTNDIITRDYNTQPPYL